MTQEDKDLLLRDLCARLPYGVKVQIKGFDFTLNDRLVQIYNGTIGQSFQVGNNMPYGIEQIKPYLRPMSSMTEEELYEVQEILGEEVEIRDGFIRIIDSSIIAFTYLELQAVFEWFNTYHFDYRGLIEKGLAIEVTEENNPYKEIVL